MADTRMDDDVSSETEDGEEGMGSQVVTNRRSRSAGKTWGAGGAAHLTQELQGKEIANKGADGADKLKRRIVKASRMPQLPEEHRKIIVRPRGGLNLNKVSTAAIGEAIVEAAGLTEDQAKGDIVCPNFTQNIVVVSTPDFDHAEKYVRLKSITLIKAEYEVSAYETAPHSTCKAVIRVNLNDSQSVITKKIEAQVRFEEHELKINKKKEPGATWADKVKGTVKATGNVAIASQIQSNDTRVEQLIREVISLKKANEELKKQIHEMNKGLRAESSNVAVAKSVSRSNSQEEEGTPAPKKRAVVPEVESMCSVLEEIKNAIKDLKDTVDSVNLKVDKI
ncbi:hypothetical protein HPB49_010937 [Dermacentor silvarum]|uniref:Uncharacterized protein n=1 Tax=Dermacentor silvarum TaxID=543639 RepID=A0ACB8C347_DERSI|nr:hypothetical protein HPB49_010937 [Dermacentor silvarum]